MQCQNIQSETVITLI